MQSFGHPFTILHSIDSTNNYAMQMAHARMATHGAAWFAHEQTRGKGQRGRTWQNNPGQNIALSILTEPEFLLPTESFLLTAAFALGTLDFVKKYVKEQVSIKWPNDIYWNDRKAGGILIESVIRGNSWKYAVAGIGINVNQEHFDETLSRAVSLRQITSDVYDVVALAKELCTSTAERYQMLQDGRQALLLQDYHYALYGLNREVTLKLEEGTTGPCLVEGVTDDGQLRIRRPNGESTNCSWGTVEWVLPDL